MSKMNNIPVCFFGQTRRYQVFGVQDSTVYGVNIVPKIVGSEHQLRLEMVFACLNQPPETTLFKNRGSAHFLVLMEDKEGAKTYPHGGFRMNKIEIDLGNGFNQFTALAHIKTQMVALKQWFDDTCQGMGIVALYDSPDEIFDKFFGANSDSDAQPKPFTLKPLADLNMTEKPSIDYTKYGKPIGLKAEPKPADKFTGAPDAFDDEDGGPDDLDD